MRKLEDAVRPVVALEGRPLPPLTADERAICDLLTEQKGWHASAVGLTRWIRQNKDARKADAAIVEAAERLWAGMLIGKDVDGTTSAKTDPTPTVETRNGSSDSRRQDDRIVDCTTTQPGASPERGNATARSGRRRPKPRGGER